MIEVTLREIIDAKPALEDLAKYGLKARAAYRVARTLKKIEVELNLEQEQHKVLINKYGKKKEDGSLDVTPEGNYLIEEEHLDEYFKEYKELLDTLVNLDCDCIDLADIEEVVLTPTKMNSLLAFIHE